MVVALGKEKQSCRMPTRSAGVTFLSDLRTGDSGVVMSLHGGGGFRSKMLSLGIIPGNKISIINGGCGQPFVIKMGDTRLMLGWGMAQKVAVSAVTSDAQRGN